MTTETKHISFDPWAGLPSLTGPQERCLVRVADNGGVKEFNGRKYRTLAKLEEHGLVSLEYDIQISAIGKNSELHRATLTGLGWRMAYTLTN